jgi:hypothetical protein
MPEQRRPHWMDAPQPIVRKANDLTRYTEHGHRDPAARAANAAHSRWMRARKRAAAAAAAAASEAGTGNAAP